MVTAPRMKAGKTFRKVIEIISSHWSFLIMSLRSFLNVSLALMETTRSLILEKQNRNINVAAPPMIIIVSWKPDARLPLPSQSVNGKIEEETISVASPLRKKRHDRQPRRSFWLSVMTPATEQ
ncbi:hypothetical protein D3C75_694160 [compost metagenome]